MSVVEDIQLLPYHWHEENKHITNDNTNILVWGLDRDSKPVLGRFLNFPQSCYVELPKFVGSYEVKWSAELAEMVYNNIKFRLKDNAPHKWRLVNKPKLYYYQAGATNAFLQLQFKTKDDMMALTKMLNKPLVIKDNVFNCRVWEANISIIRKMLTIKNLRYSQWFNVKGTKCVGDDKISTVENEYIMNFTTIDPIPETETIDWATHPGLLAIDGEMYSSNPKAFPNMEKLQDECYMISCIYQRVDKPETRKRYCLVIGDIPDLDNAEVIRCIDELDLTNKYTELVNKLDPEIITGYNILAFDLPYFEARRKKTGVAWPQMGRLKGRNAWLKSLDWNSSGSGFNSINFLMADGRIYFDCMKIARRELKLPKYDLNTVAKSVLNGASKHNTTAQDMFRIYKEYITAERIVKNSKALGDHISPELQKEIDQRIIAAKLEYKVVAEYCVQDSELVIDLFDAWKSWIYLVELSKIVGINMEDLFTRGQQIRVLHQVYDLAARQGYVIDKRNLPEVEWAGGFVFEPKPGLYDFVICLDYKSLYPSIMIAYNLCYRTLIRPEMMDSIPDEKCNIIEWTEEVDTADKSNLIDDDDNDIYAENDDDPDNDGLEKPKMIKVIRYKYKFIKPEKIIETKIDAITGQEIQVEKIINKGILPKLVEDLINERNAVKAQMKTTKDKNFKEILDKRQLGLKVTANSMFGALGAQKGGKLPLVEVARVITAKGRELIQYCNKYVEDKYNALVVYNDTDSTMFVLPFTKNYDEAVDWGLRLEKEISALFPDPLYTETEKIGRQLCIRKKKYCFWEVELHDNPKKGRKKGEFIPFDDDGLLIRGIILARRDNCQFQRDTYRKVIYNILLRRGMQENLDIITEAIVKMYLGQVDWNELIMIKGLGAHYKSDSYFMKIFGEELAKIGKPAAPGERLEYVIVNSNKFNKNDLLGYKMRIPETYLERLETEDPEPVDSLYYIEKIMMNCIEQLWQIGYKPELDELAKKHAFEDKVNVVNYLANMDQRKYAKVLELYNYFGGNYELIYDNIFDYEGLKTAAKTARAAIITGRNVFQARIDKNPIKKLFKAINKRTPERDTLKETILAFATPELAEKLISQLPEPAEPTAAITA